MAAQREERVAQLIPLANLAETDVATAGTKATALAELSRSGFPVPDGLVVTVAASAEIAMAGRVPDSLRAALAVALPRLGDGSLVVRSSAAAEDSPNASYAGQYVTVLGIPSGAEGLDALCAGIVEV